MSMELLVVDDEEGIREMLREAFSRHGYDVRTAASGEEALAVFEQKQCKVIIMDLKLPGISGVDACREIRKNNPICCIFALTGYSKLFELAECREAGFDDYFYKPVKLSVLAKAVNDAFERITRWSTRPDA